MKKLSLSLLALFLFALPAAAQMDWSMVGSAGTIDEQASTAVHEYAGARLRFLAGQTGTIVARYPVTNTVGSASTLQPGWDVLRLTYIDDGGPASVTARLISVDECSGAEEQLCSVTGSGSDGPSCSICVFPPVMDFGTYSYYVEAMLTRAVPTTNETLISVSLH